jgi:hypothetical protein
MLTNFPVFERAKAVTLSDTTDIPSTDPGFPNARALWIGVSGDVKLTTICGDTVVIPAVPVGLLPIAARRVYATGTTATSVFALY